MSDFSFLAVPNIEGMRLWWYIQIFGICIIFGMCLFFVVYSWLIYRRKQKLVHQSDDFDQQAQDLNQTLLRQNIKKSTGKNKLILFIEYLERFITTDATGARPVQAYANLWELLLPQWFTPAEVEEFQLVLYTDKQLSKHSEHRIDTYFTS